MDKQLKKFANRYEEQMQFLIAYFQEGETVISCPSIVQNDEESTEANSESMDLCI